MNDDILYPSESLDEPIENGCAECDDDATYKVWYREDPAECTFYFCHYHLWNAPALVRDYARGDAIPRRLTSFLS